MNQSPNPIRWLLRAEAAAVLVAVIAMYAVRDAGWGRFAALFLVPDLALFGYLAGPRAGAVAYNAAHSYLGPGVIAAIAITGAAPTARPYALIWAAHCAFDRALGYGLKYTTGFRHTHLGTIGRAAAA